MASANDVEREQLESVDTRVVKPSQAKSSGWRCYLFCEERVSNKSFWNLKQPEREIVEMLSWNFEIQYILIINRVTASNGLGEEVLYTPERALHELFDGLRIQLDAQVTASGNFRAWSIALDTCHHCYPTGGLDPQYG